MPLTVDPSAPKPVAKLTSTDPATPGAPTWMCAPVMAPLRPLHVTLYLKNPVAALKAIAPLPVAVVDTAGTSALPVSVAYPNCSAGGVTRPITWPRISPPVFAAVWMFTYTWPDVRYPTCAAVSPRQMPVTLVVVPLSPGITNSGPAVMLVPEGPWKCAPVTDPVNPVTVTEYHSEFPFSTNVVATVPVPVVVTGGTSPMPFRTAQPTLSTKICPRISPPGFAAVWIYATMAQVR